MICAIPPIALSLVRALRELTGSSMATPKQDIEPELDLKEEDEDQSLPEAEPVPGEGDLSGPLAAGRTAILAHARHAPAAPGVYRMFDAAGEVLYVGKARHLKKRVLSYARGAGHNNRIARIIADT